jgi:hypothetical protein
MALPCGDDEHPLIPARTLPRAATFFAKRMIVDKTILNKRGKT